MSAAHLDKNNTSLNNNINPNVSNFQPPIIHLEDDNVNNNDFNNINKGNKDPNQIINILIQYAKESFEKLNNKFDVLSQKQNNLEQMFFNMKINDKDQNAYNARMNKKAELRKDKINFNLYTFRSNNKKSNDHFFKPNDFNDNEVDNLNDNNDDEKDNINEINDDKESIDILLEEDINEEVKGENITDLDKFINTYQTQLKNYNLSLESVFPNIDILSKFNSLNLYNENTNYLNNKRYDIINLRSNINIL